MKKVFLSIGSNINPAVNIPRCLRLLREKFHLVKTSSIYETAPVGPAGTNKFWNLAIEIATDLDSDELKHELRHIESELDRVRDPADKFAPRTIDLDLLPQPEDEKQPFIIIPLAEIAPEDKAPETGKSYRLLAEDFLREGFEIRKIRI
jgi:2-amino-4-hydroxy-6-hydroxymethyldihydropteridine diphosphokinase